MNRKIPGKILITRMQHDEYQYEGIRIVDAADWLLEGQKGEQLRLFVI